MHLKCQRYSDTHHGTPFEYCIRRYTPLHSRYAPLYSGKLPSTPAQQNNPGQAQDDEARKVASPAIFLDLEQTWEATTGNGPRHAGGPGQQRKRQACYANDSQKRTTELLNSVLRSLDGLSGRACAHRAQLCGIRKQACDAEGERCTHPTHAELPKDFRLQILAARNPPAVAAALRGTWAKGKTMAKLTQTVSGREQLNGHTVSTPVMVMRVCGP